MPDIIFRLKMVTLHFFVVVVIKMVPRVLLTTGAIWVVALVQDVQADAPLIIQVTQTEQVEFQTLEPALKPLAHPPLLQMMAAPA